MSVPKQLQDVAEEVRQGKRPTVTVRQLLSWFYSERRGFRVVSHIRSALREVQLKTVPDFDWIHLDGTIALEVEEAKPPEAAESSSSAPAVGHGVFTADAMLMLDSVEVRLSQDPTFRIGRLGSANKPPAAVPPDATIDEAVTIMLKNDFSQVPVMTSDRDVKGMFSWRSLAGRLALGRACQRVGECMDRHHEITHDASLFEAINIIVQHESVLVRDSTQRISGIVTTSDLSLQFRQLAEPFLLLAEIENQVRRIIDNKFSLQELESIKDPEDTSRKIEGVDDLTFGEYQRLLEDPSRWERLGLKIDRKAFVKDLDDVRRIRNEVMHFDPDGVGEEDLAALQRFVQFLQRLRELTP